MAGLGGENGLPTQMVSTVPADQEQVIGWAVAIRNGRFFSIDPWELQLIKGERLKVLEDRENNWYVCKTIRGNEEGWVHGNFIRFEGERPQENPRDAYARYKADVEQRLGVGNVRVFPALHKYVLQSCSKEMCGPARQDTKQLGICIHELRALMDGSGEYSPELLRRERVKWHPDRFVRYCDPAYREVLREKAQMMFVLFGVLLEALEKEDAPA